MLKKGSKLYSIFTGTCPNCQEESMYTHSNPYNLPKLFEMHDHCSKCTTRYKIEPSFFFGAMYISYMLGVAMSVAIFIISYVFIGTTLKTSFILIMGAMILGMPILIRLSRNIWINLYIKYGENKFVKSNG